VNFREDGEYRRRLADGFLSEARLNFQHNLWRSCVDNSQLSMENSCKMVIALLEPVEKTHNPSRQLKRLIQTERLGKEHTKQVEEIAAIVDQFGTEEHFMTDYGDENTRTDPWSLFDEEDAREALDTAERCFQLANEVFQASLGKMAESSK
jgi:HEPN domain-containing protein